MSGEEVLAVAGIRSKHLMRAVIGKESQALAASLPVDDESAVVRAEVVDLQRHQLADADTGREQELDDCKIPESEKGGVRVGGETTGYGAQLSTSLAE